MFLNRGLWLAALLTLLGHSLRGIEPEVYRGLQGYIMFKCVFPLNRFSDAGFLSVQGRKPESKKEQDQMDWT